jgi:hypothetical protein
MGVIFWQKIFEGPNLLHQGEEIGVVEEEDVEPHFDVVAIGVFPAAHLAAHEWACLVEVHLMARIDKIYRSGKASETGTDNRDPHLETFNSVDSMYEPP